MQRVRHPNVVPILEVGRDNRDPFVVLPFVTRDDLQIVTQRRRLSVTERIELFAGIARGLHAVHAGGHDHLGFTPHNVLIAPDTRPLLTAFGVPPRGAATDDATRARRVEGSPRYMSPEQISGGPLTPASDQFSFGIALYEALFCRHPFVHTHAASLHAAVLGGAVVPSNDRGVPARVHAAVLRCLQTDPGQRFASMQEVADVLHTVSSPTKVLVAMGLCTAVGLALVAFA